MDRSEKICILPDSWETRTIGDVAFVKGGKRLPKGQRFADKPTPFPYIRVTDFANFSVTKSDIRYLRQETRENIKNYTIAPRDVYISIAGTIGITGMIPPELDGANLTENAAKILITSPSLDPRFLMFYLASDTAQVVIMSQTVKNAQPKLALARIKSLNIPIPESSEQLKIVSVLGLVQRAIEQQERLIALSQELKKALMHKLFTEGLRGELQKQTEIGPVPESWEVMQFEEFALLQRGFDLPKSEFKTGSIPVVGATSIIGFHNVSNVRGPGVTVVRSGSSAGKPLFIENDFWAHNVVLFVKNFHGHNPKFVYYKIQSLDLTKYREGVAVPSLNRNSFRTIPVAVPRRDEQDEFVQTLDCVEQKEMHLDQKNRLLEDLFRTLLHQLMTAQIRVHDLDLSFLQQEAVAS